MAPLCQGSSDIYTPALPEISRYFGLNHTWSQLTIIVYLFSYAIGQLIWGYFSDRYGRRPALLYGMGIGAVGFLVSPLSHSMGLLLFSRIIQGIGLGAIGVNYKTIIVDSFNKQEVYKASSMANSAWGLGPILAPFIGGYLTAWMGWKANFWFLLIYIVLSIIIVATTLQETLPKPIKTPFKQVLQVYRSHLTSLAMWSGIVVLTAIYVQMLAFNLLAPFLIIRELHYSVIHYGHIALAMGVAFILGSIVNNKCVQYIKPHFLCYYPVALAVVAAIAMVITHCVMPLNLWGVLIPSLVINFTVGLVFPNTVIRTQYLFKKNMGLTTSTIGVLMLFLTGICTLLISFSPATSMLPLALWDLAMSVISLIGYYILHHHSSD
ncbi:MAG: multidrug effflux MFS transporter [Coxiellaceae bacterium]|nr:multidrug effflux MFS transporter [Coxiellaceae bacterium]